MAIFKVGTHDYSKNVVDSTDNINEIPQFKEWEDGLGNRHQDQRGVKREGSVQLFFKTMSEYETFLSHLNSAKYNSENQYTLTVKSNNNAPTTEVTIHAFVSFEPQRALKGDMTEYMKPFDFTIKES